MENRKEIKTTKWKALNAVIKARDDREDAHFKWDAALLVRLRQLGDLQFADAAERIQREIGFWYA